MENTKFSLAALRVNAGYTQTKIAEILGVTQGSVAQWEKGATYPRVGRAKKLAKLYGVTLEEIYSAKPQEKNSNAQRRTNPMIPLTSDPAQEAALQRMQEAAEKVRHRQRRDDDFAGRLKHPQQFKRISRPKEESQDE